MDQELTEKLKDLYKVQKKIDELSEAKNRVKRDVEDLIVECKLEGKKFAIGDRTISYNLRTTTQGLSQKYLAETLTTYYERDPDEADRLLRFILEGRAKTQKYQLDIVKQKK